MLKERRNRHFGIVTQVYPPDPAAVGQHLADVAEELGRRGHRVTVFTADSGYDNPSQRYARFERNGNVAVLRLPLASFGKSSISLRLLGGASLFAQASVLTALDFRLTDLLLSTIPHFVGALGVAMKVIRHLPFHYWLMDLNPDQMVALGKLRADSRAVKAFDLINRGILRHAKSITTLDEVMARRFSAKSTHSPSIDIQPPWPGQGHTQPVDHSINPFRARFGLTSRRVVMHAGNHSAVHPLDTFVQAIRLLGQSSVSYFFVGGGVGKAGIERWVSAEKPPNVTLLPYQPRGQVHSMLCAADVHVVAVGNNTVGIVHPSKIYGALAAGRPVLVFGPRESPVARLVTEWNLGWQVEHGAIAQACSVLKTIEQLPEEELHVLKARALQVCASQFSRKRGIEQFCNRLLS